MTEKYTSPDRLLLQQLAQAPKGIQPTLLKIATHESTKVTTDGPTLFLGIPYETLQDALHESQLTRRRDLAVASVILIGTMVITTLVIILLRG
jgi:hypothetical protein